MEELINLLKVSDLKSIEKATKIPYDRMRKWITTNARPKTVDFDILSEYFKIGKSSINELQHDNIEQGVPMYNAKGAGSGVEIYTDKDSSKIVGYLNFPGITKGSFALQVFGSSMNPTLESGDWCVLRPIENKNDIAWGQVYYIEWAEYRLFKRLLLSDNDNDVILWSDNQTEVIEERPIHSAIHLKKSDIRSICLVTDIYKKSNN